MRRSSAYNRCRIGKGNDICTECGQVSFAAESEKAIGLTAAAKFFFTKKNEKIFPECFLQKLSK